MKQSAAVMSVQPSSEPGSTRGAVACPLDTRELLAEPLGAQGWLDAADEYARAALVRWVFADPVDGAGWYLDRGLCSPQGWPCWHAS